MTDLPPFFSAGIDTISALKLFVHVSTMNDTRFTASTKQIDDYPCPVIQFAGHQAKGTITRTLEELSITIMPDAQTAKDFVPRTMLFRQVDFAGSKIMPDDEDVILANDGRSYARTIAETIALAHPKSRWAPSPCGGEHTILYGPPQGPDISESLKRLAQEIDGEFHGKVHCLLAHPALDLRADCLLLDNENRALLPDGSLGEQLAAMREAAQNLPTALRITQHGAAYPLPYRIYPHRVTIEAEPDPAMRTARGMIARAAISDPEATRGQFHYTLVPLDAAGEFEAEKAAEAASIQLIEDWKAVMGDKPLPTIGDDFKIENERSNGRLVVRLVVIIDQAIAETYSLVGQYELVPE